MFLQQLNNEQKQQFLTFALYLASLDNDFSANEDAMLSLYCSEMGIPYDRSSVAPYSSETIEAYKANSGSKERKALVFELIGLAMCDSNFDKAERDFMKNLAKDLELSDEFVLKSEKCLGSYVELQKEMNALVLQN